MTIEPSVALLTEMRGSALWLTSNREDKRNALNQSVNIVCDQALDGGGRGQILLPMPVQAPIALLAKCRPA